MSIVEGGKTDEGLNMEQEMFCQLFVSSDKEMFGNGVNSYVEAYPIDKTQKNWYKTACACASRLLSNAKIIKRINDLLESWGLNDENIDKQLLRLIAQYEDKGTKLAAIKEYNRLKARILEKAQDINVYNFTGKDPKELEAMRKSLLGIE